MTVLIRDYALSDRDSVNRVALAAFAQYESHYDDWTAFSDGIGRMAELAGDADLIVAERDGIVAGAIAHIGPGAPRSPIYPDDWSVIRMLVVDPAQRSAGIGRQLVAACLQRAREAGAPVIGLHTSPIMAHALSLYTRIGFEFDRELAPIRGVPYSRYVLARAGIPAALQQLGSTAGTA